MAQIIEIEGNIARLVNRDVQTEIELEHLTPFLSFREPTVSPVLPPGTVAHYLNPDTNELLLMVERPPRIEPIRLQILNPTTEMKDQWAQELGYDDFDAMPETFTLPLPWEYYIFSGEFQKRETEGTDYYAINSVSLYWKPTRFKNYGEIFYEALLPNVNGAHICWGDTNNNAGHNLSDKVTSMINGFYLSPFNEHWGHMKFPIKPANAGTIAVDEITGIPDYDWDLLRQTIINWPEGKLGIPAREIEAEMPPETWRITEIRTWVEGLTQGRRDFLRELLA